MIIEVKVPSPGESISEVQLASWLVEDGAIVEKDQEIAEIDSDKATLTINAEEEGKISLLVGEGDTIEVGTVVAKIDTSVKGTPGKAREKTATEKAIVAESATVAVAEPSAARKTEPAVTARKETEKVAEEPGLHLSPLARKLLESKDISEKDFLERLKSYRFSRKDVEFVLEDRQVQPAKTDFQVQQSAWQGSRDTERRKLSTLRLKVAARLVAVKNETAMLTTFNEVNMEPIVTIRNRYKEAFKEKYGLSLGFMSFFTRAITEALQLFPQVNAQIDGDEVIFHHFADIGIAVSTPKGLMVPVLRNAEKMSIVEIERQIKDLAVKARDGKISLDEMKGGTFTITNGGVFGSMLSTPIINPPQSAILGMHNIVERPVAVDGKVEIRPVMYVALSYDHRIIDGRESVSFLVKVKEMLENPARMLFGGEDPAKALVGL